ncbi:MAG TPA: hypothetical protein VGH83_06050 [Candidatus Acidoferrum sp.]
MDEATLATEQQNCAAQLARFFPGVKEVRVQVQVSALRGGSTRLREACVVEFATPEHAIFISTVPLEFDDKVRLEGGRKGYQADATVVAVQYHDGRKAVAVKFLRGPCNWMMPS